MARCSRPSSPPSSERRDPFPNERPRALGTFCRVERHRGGLPRSVEAARDRLLGGVTWGSRLRSTSWRSCWRTWATARFSSRTSSAGTSGMRSASGHCWSRSRSTTEPEAYRPWCPLPGRDDARSREGAQSRVHRPGPAGARAGCRRWHGRMSGVVRAPRAQHGTGRDLHRPRQRAPAGRLPCPC